MNEQEHQPVLIVDMFPSRQGLEIILLLQYAPKSIPHGIIQYNFSRAYWVVFCEICFNHHGSLEVLRVGPSMLGTAA